MGQEELPRNVEAGGDGRTEVKGGGLEEDGPKTTKSICERILTVTDYAPRDARLKGRAAEFRHAELGRLLVERRVERLIDGLPHQILYALCSDSLSTDSMLADTARAPFVSDLLFNH